MRTGSSMLSGETFRQEGSRRVRTPLARGRWRAALAALVLAAVAFAAFIPALSNGFIAWDDDEYITLNPVVREGLTPRGAAWALTAVHANNWHPLTWVSHMADVSLFGEDPRGHHLTSLLLHALNTALLFGLLRALTGAWGPSALAAALFAAHPLRVESVAWVAERKDVLSAALWLLTIHAWLAHLRKPGAARWVGACIACALSLAAKPMAVTLPAVLLILDYWPLGRWGTGRGAAARSPGSLVAEKSPFLVMALAVGVATFVIQQRTGAMIPLDALPLGVRLGTALSAYGAYLARSVWPSGLSVLYLHPEALPQPLVLAGSVGALALLSGAAWRLRSRAPWLAAGWLWFLVTLLPVIGIVQVGLQWIADRYTYLPSMGLCVLAAFGATALAGTPRRRLALLLAATAAVVALGAASWSRAGAWRDTGTLFSSALAADPGNWLAHNKVGEALLQRGEAEAAERHFAAAARLKPAFALARFNLGRSFAGRGRWAEAEVELRAAVALRPGLAMAWQELGAVLFRQGRYQESLDALRVVVRLSPGDATARSNVGLALERLGRRDEAAAAAREALKIEPGMGDALLLQDRLRRAATGPP